MKVGPVGFPWAQLGKALLTRAGSFLIRTGRMSRTGVLLVVISSTMSEEYRCIACKKVALPCYFQTDNICIDCYTFMESFVYEPSELCDFCCKNKYYYTIDCCRCIYTCKTDKCLKDTILHLKRCNSRK